MIKLIGPKGERHYINPDAIAIISEAGDSSQWHGIRSIVKMIDGTILEVSEKADEIHRLIEGK